MAPITHLHCPFRGLPNIHPHTFNTNPRTVQGPVVHIGETPRRERVSIDTKKVGGNRMGCWEYPLSAAYPSELA